ncbi:MAG: hypothetical protein LBG64_04185 [Pseudomonadales bacterium]|jgi:hypothetical protein|nr:hypothetical protein [Pseudomonadales bacterium]
MNKRQKSILIKIGVIALVIVFVFGSLATSVYWLHMQNRMQREFEEAWAIHLEEMIAWEEAQATLSAEINEATESGELEEEVVIVE